mmetsp:Transcript_888/g.1224  ORF Transcript_888/g.1224 Transcript_888/m.1224 type:complete len:134 (+) Transcript_888:78-479(+)
MTGLQPKLQCLENEYETHGHPTHWTDGTSASHSKVIAVTLSGSGRPNPHTSATQWRGSLHTSKYQWHQRTISYSPDSKKSTTPSNIKRQILNVPTHRGCVPYQKIQPAPHSVHCKRYYPGKPAPMQPISPSSK